MEIIIAENIGFCFGVERAYNLSLETLKKNNNCQMLGNLVHNERVIESLKEKGLKFISEANQVKPGTVIIRSHGVSRKVFQDLQDKNINIIDATCPFVKKAQNLAKDLKDEGRKVVIIGEKDHAEVKAINGFIDDQAIIVESEKQINSIPKDEPIGIVIQTTQDVEKTKKFIQEIKKQVKDIKIHETFCQAVSKRQEEVKKLIKETDIVLVVGSKTSANTQRLVSIVLDQKKQVYGIENKQDINKDWFFKGIKVGVISGTSAPIWLINEIINELNKIKNQL